MNKQIIIEQLQNLGIEEIEANIYIYLLEKGSRTHLELFCKRRNFSLWF